MLSQVRLVGLREMIKIKGRQENEINYIRFITTSAVGFPLLFLKAVEVPERVVFVRTFQSTKGLIHRQTKKCNYLSWYNLLLRLLTRPKTDPSRPTPDPVAVTTSNLRIPVLPSCFANPSGNPPQGWAGILPPRSPQDGSPSCTSPAPL